MAVKIQPLESTARDQKLSPISSFALIDWTIKTGRESRNGTGKKKMRTRFLVFCTSSISPSTIPLTSGIEEAPQLLLSVTIFLPYFFSFCKHLKTAPQRESIIEQAAELCYKTVGPTLPAPVTMRIYEITSQIMP